MSAVIIQIEYDATSDVGDRFIRQADNCQALLQQVTQALEALRERGWEGQGAEAFFAEMDQTLVPGLQRLIAALETAQSTTRRASDILREAEEAAAGLFGGSVAGAVVPPGAGGGALGFIGDFFGGALDEAGNMLSGLANTVMHPIQTLEGLKYGITHPDKLWEAFSKPYVDDWNNGHPGRAIGRGVLFLGSMLVGAKGLDKLAKGGEVIEVAGTAGRLGEAGEVVGTAGRLGDVSETVGVAGRVGEGVEGVVPRAGKLLPDEVRGIKVHKQLDHIKDTPRYLDRIRRGKEPSYWLSAEEADSLTMEAWQKGIPERGRPTTVRVHDFERPVGFSQKGGVLTKVKVHRDKNGLIHGHPAGRELP